MTTLQEKYKDVVDRWESIPTSFPEADLEDHLMWLMWETLGIGVQQRKKTAGIGSGLKPDWLIYRDPNQPPVLVVEDKRRVPELAAAAEEVFADVCRQHSLYKSAVGKEASKENGIKQYLNTELVREECLASYGLVFNGDFFQLWRRVDGLVFPLTPIQKVNQRSLPVLMEQLAHCLQNPHSALVAAIWNQKGGVAKTTNIVNIGAALSLQDKRVLLIDFDPQGDLTRSVGLDSEQSPNYLETCVKKLLLAGASKDRKEQNEAKSLLNQAIQRRKFATTDGQPFCLFVLAHSADSLKKFRDAKDFQPNTIFRRIVALLRKDFDYIFIDTSPTPDKLVHCILLTCDTVLIPADLGSKSLHHAVQLYEKTIPSARGVRAKQEQMYLGPWNLGMVFSNCPADVGPQLEKCISRELEARSFVGKQCNTKLQTYAQVKVSEFKHMPVICWQSSRITKQYGELVNELFINHNFTDH